MGRERQVSNNSHTCISHCLVFDNFPMLQIKFNLDYFLRLDFSWEGCGGLFGSQLIMQSS